MDMSEILDSGNRTEFESGAVRDIQQDKGRCDLMPLKIVGRILDATDGQETFVLQNLEIFKETKDVDWLYEAIGDFIKEAYEGDAVYGFLEVSIHFKDGAKKYGENNWQKGLPEWSYLSSAVRHYLKWRSGNTDERHDRAFIWNILCLIWTLEHKEGA